MTGEIDLSNAIAGNYQATYTPPSNWQQMHQKIGIDVYADGIPTSMNAAGDRLAIGAYQNNGNDAGHVRIYEWTGTTWIQLGADIDGETAFDDFGYSVSMDAAGNRVAIGAPWNCLLYTSPSPRD